MNIKQSAAVNKSATTLLKKGQTPRSLLDAAQYIRRSAHTRPHIPRVVQAESGLRNSTSVDTSVRASRTAVDACAQSFGQTF